MNRIWKHLVLGASFSALILSGCTPKTDESSASSETGTESQAQQPTPSGGGNIGIVSPGAGPNSPVTNSEAVEGGGGGGLYNKAKEQARGVADKANTQQAEGNEALDK